MNRLVFVLLFLTCLQVRSQTINGQILQSGTSIPVAHANIYFDGSFQGTISDEGGNFKLSSTISNRVPIIISCIGYISQTVTNYSAEQPLKISLKVANTVLKEVVVKNDGMPYEEKLGIFIKEYLGTSIAAQKCVIENVDDIDFVYDKTTATLRASSVNPLIIRNQELGYRIKSFLNTFIFSKTTIAYSGNQLFDDSVASRDPAIKLLREDTYLGSRMHFVRSLWENKLEENGFEIYDSANRKIAANKVVYLNKKDQRHLVLREPIKIKYANRISYVRPFNKSTSNSYIEKNGFIDLTDIIWRGYMSSQRVGDLLPLEYSAQK